MLPSAGVSSVANHASWNAFAFTIAIALCLVCLYTDFLAKRLEQAMPLQIAGIITGSTAAVLWLLHCLLKRSGPWFDLGVVGAAILVALGFLWVNYQSDLEAYRTNCDDPQHLSIATNDVLGEVSDAWLAVRNRLHPGDVVAYANFAEAYPLMGFDLSHPVIYCPARPDVDSIVHIPTLPRHLSGEQIDAAFSNALLADSDEATWLTRLAASHARWLVIRAGDGVPPPELRFVADHPAQFNPIPGPSNFRVYQIRP